MKSSRLFNLALPSRRGFQLGGCFTTGGLRCALQVVNIRHCYLLHSFGAASRWCLGRLRFSPACSLFVGGLTLPEADLALSAMALQKLASRATLEHFLTSVLDTSSLNG